MARHELIEERLTHSPIGAFFDVYNTLGFGFLEVVYCMALERELIGRAHHVSREVWIPVVYKDQELCKQRLDMVVDEKLIIETKSTPDLPRTGSRQLYNYLRATNLSVGLLFHFGPEPKFYRLVGPRWATSLCAENQRAGRSRIACPPPGANTSRNVDADVTGRREIATGSGFVSQCALGPSA